MLPDGFRWQSIYGTGSARDSGALACKGYEVARMSEKVGGGWAALLRYPNGRDVHRTCSSYETGKAGIVAWAKRHEAALVARCEAREREWLARRGCSSGSPGRVGAGQKTPTARGTQPLPPVAPLPD